MRTRRRRSGFTLLEVLLVMAILVILLTIAYPSIDGMYGPVRLTAAADQLRSVFAEARAHAIEGGRPYRFAIMPNQSSYRVAPDDSDTWGGGNDASSNSDSSAPAYIVEDKLEGVVFMPLNSASGDSGPWARVVTFLPDGTCGEDAEIELTAPGCRPLCFRVRALTGAVRVQTVSGKEGY